MDREDDPFEAILRPPVDEAPEARSARLQQEAEARRISESIDAQIRHDAATKKKNKKPVKVLLLGQSESGKSATLKNFQLTFAPREWEAERMCWRAVIQLNLVRNVNFIVDIIARSLDKSGHGSGHDTDSDRETVEHGRTRSGQHSPRQFGTSMSDHGSFSASASPTLFNERHRLLQLRLAPLRRVQKDLEKMLGASAQEVRPPPDGRPTVATPWDRPSNSRTPQDFQVESTDGWKSALERLRPRQDAPTYRARGALSSDELTECIVSCKEDIVTLWNDPIVRERLERRRNPIEESAGFFLDDVQRIATRQYEPTDSDVLRARLRTVGAQEHRFHFSSTLNQLQEWHMYDVGGARSSRAIWASYFEDVHAILFLAPISCFDEKLAEDRTENRLEDSYKLWKSVVENKLLARTQTILLLNKCDLLDAKLTRGVKVKNFIPSYGDKPNDLHHVTKYFRDHFREIMRQHSPVPRTFYVYFTAVIDIQATRQWLGKVAEGIMQEHLRSAALAL